jgi:putative copper resistance protein D
VLAAVAMLPGVVAAGIGVLALADALIATGLPDPGPVTTLGLPFTRAVGEIAAVTAVGGTMFAAFLTPPQDNGVLDVGSYRALRLAAAASGVAAVCAALMVPLTISDVSGEPVREHLNPIELWRVAGLVDAASAWRWTALIAAAVAVSARLVLRWSPTPMLFAGSLLTLVPLGLTGHSATGGSHDVATDSLLIHLFAGALWAGGLLALLAHALRAGAYCDVAARRFSAIALWCFIAMAVSGTINAGVRIRPADLFSTAYGWLIAAKVSALVVLGLIGWRHRRGAVAALQSDPGARGALIRLAMVEALVFAVTFGIAVGLGRTPPPPARSSPTAAEVALGYDLPGPPNLARIMTDWRFDLIFGSAAIVAATIYLAAVIRLRRRGDRWPTHRTVAWLLGCAVLLGTTSSGLGSYLPAMFSAHVVGHLLLSMPAAILLVLGAPATLARSALPAAAAGGPPGPREWLMASLTGRAARLFTHPVVATVAFVAGFCYLGGVFDAAALRSLVAAYGPGVVPAFAAAFLGATQFKRRFNVWGALLAVFVLQSGVKGLQLAGVGTTWIESLFFGIALIVAVGFSTFRKRVHGGQRCRVAAPQPHLVPLLRQVGGRGVGAVAAAQDGDLHRCTPASRGGMTGRFMKIL